MKTNEVIAIATRHLKTLVGHEFDVLSISKPVSLASAANLGKIISKLSPILGNLIEFNIVDFLNAQDDFHGLGRWRRQDPGFPDAIFEGSVDPVPGFEIKAWYPMATEMTARFRDSQNAFVKDNTHVAILAWVPSHIVYGTPRIVDVCVVSGLSVAKARDKHYHNPPDYIIIEPRDTSERTRNLQQTNTAGYKFQGTPAQFKKAEATVAGWGSAGKEYSPKPEYQEKLVGLMGSFPYRLDTNYSKADRIMHEGIEQFKSSVLSQRLNTLSIAEWTKLLNQESDKPKKSVFDKILGISDPAVTSD